MTDIVETDTVAADATPTPEAVVTPPLENADAPAFAIPDAYKDKPWAAKVKSPDDLWKQLDNTQSLVGKKTVVPDLANATPKETEDFIAAMRPADKSVYQFTDDVPEAERTAYADMLHDVGIPAVQANQLIEKYQGMQKAQLEKLFSEEGLEAEKKASFGENYKVVGTEVAKVISANLNPADLEMVDKKLPNNVVGLFYRFANNMHKAYGATEGAAAVSPPANIGVVDVEVAANKLRDDINAISRRSHTAEEKQVLVNQLADLYKTKR